VSPALRRVRRALHASGLFDRAYYLARYPEVARAGWDPLVHYVTVGAAAGADPNPLFDGEHYLRTHREIGASGTNPLLHYLQRGALDGATPHPFVGPRVLAGPSPAGQPSSPTPLHGYLARRRRRGGLRVCYVSPFTGYAAHRYRVLHQVEALQDLKVEAPVVPLERVAQSIDDLADADLLVLYRVAWSGDIERLVTAASTRGTRVVYDTDDYVFDHAVANERYVDGLRFLRPDQLPEYRQGVTLYRQALLAADAAILSTQTLADAVARLGKPAYVLRNGFDQATLDLCRTLRQRPARSGPVRIGYASGTMTHQKDFGVAAPALARVLDRHPETRLVVIGTLALEEFPALAPFADRIERRPLVAHQDLPRELDRFDVNLAPLEIGNPYCEAKSNLKYYEAALLDIPSVASATQPFAEAIRSGDNGFLASSEAQWSEALEALVKDEGLRQTMGRRARAQAEAAYGPAAKREAVRDVFFALAVG
jgi:glycosyltransferase involved in cell wall biosynthesis